MRCELCQNLALNNLVVLAEKEFSREFGFPSSNFYQHHKSVHSLEQSKQTGCDLCSLLWEALQLANWGPSIEDLRTQDVSDIRIAITSDHVSSNTYDAADVLMFDYLLVQAGDRDDAIARASLPLLSHPGTEKIGRFQIGRNITDLDLRSTSNFGIVGHWLQQCCSDHKDCPSRQQDAPLPKRVVDVGGAGAGGVEIAPALFVSDDGTPTRGRYAALSHCWGGHIDVVLTKGKLEDFQYRLPVESLARNFQDALHICRELGVRYLWIDSLCIIQDSRDDWTAESSKMASIYSNAFVTISAMSSPGSSTGIFGETDTADTRDPYLSRGVPLRLSSESEEVVYALPAQSEDPENLARLYLNAPLALRAWTLQESILSPRIIFYGKDQIYWRCFAGFQSADGVPDGFQFPDNKDIRLASALQGFSEIATRPPRDRWGSGHGKGDHYHLVEEYTGRNLTVASDKLPAFSGLAERIHSSMGGDYLAGLFTEDLHQGLLWTTEPGSDSISMKTTNDGEDGTSLKQYRAPSWSWASKDGRVDFEGNFMTDVTPIQQLKLKDSHIRCRDPRHPYGEVLPGSYITVTGLARRLVLSKQARKGPKWKVSGGAKAMLNAHIFWDDHRRQSRESSSRGQDLFVVPVPPPQASEEGTTEPATQQRGTSVFVVMEDTSDSKSDEWEKEWVVLPELFTRDEFILLMVRNFWDWNDEDHEYGTYGTTHCMIVQKADEGPLNSLNETLQGPLYSRAGIIGLRNFGEAVGWEEMTLKII